MCMLCVQCVGIRTCVHVSVYYISICMHVYMHACVYMYVGVCMCVCSLCGCKSVCAYVHE